MSSNIDSARTLFDAAYSHDVLKPRLLHDSDKPCVALANYQRNASIPSKTSDKIISQASTIALLSVFSNVKPRNCCVGAQSSFALVF
jgi:hypothetical protein